MNDNVLISRSIFSFPHIVSQSTTKFFKSQYAH